MNFKYDEEQLINDLSCHYIIKSDHRNNYNNLKSKWIISEKEEINLFILSYKNNWGENKILWGINKDASNHIIIIGKNKFGNELKIAKFIDSFNGKKWHGYPADYVFNTQDRPTIDILKLWKDLSIIEKHHISKIRSGKICNL